MSRHGKGVWFSVLAALLLVVIASFLASKPTRQMPAFSSDIPAQVPPPVGTYYPPPSTPAPIEPTWTPSPLPPPPAASTMPPVPGELPNIVWATLMDTGLTLWGGRYGDGPSPAVVDARVVARWTVALDIRSMAASPDGRYLAILTRDRCILPPPLATPILLLPPAGEPCIDTPQFLYVVDLLTNGVQPIPDYSNHDLYTEYGPYRSQYYEVMGWFDNDRIALDAGQLVVATRDGASFERRAFPNLTGGDHTLAIQLLPDRRTLFVWVNDEFYLRDADTGDIRKVGDRSSSKDVWYDNILASPNGQYISYMGPDVASRGMDFRHISLSLQNFADGSRHLIMPNGVWDARPAWSPDSSQLAFARTTAVPQEDASIFESDKADTDIYVATVADLQVRQVTAFTGVHNRDIQWTPGGNLLVASSFGSSNETSGLVWVSAREGSALRLWTPPPGETLGLSLLFTPQIPTGMPGVGADPGQP